MAVIWNSTRPFRAKDDTLIHKGEEVPAEYCTPAFLAGAANQILITEGTHGHVEQSPTP